MQGDFLISREASLASVYVLGGEMFPSCQLFLL